jgi:predicted phosphodiesterase
MRLAIISDIHEDYVYLKRSLRKIRSRGYDKLICLGDISGFSSPFYKYWISRNASACLNLLKESCDIVIPGNHDLHKAGRIPEYSAVFDFPQSWYEMDLRRRSELSQQEIWLHDSDLDANLGTEDLAYLQTLSEYEILDTADYRILFSHYAYPNLSGFLKSFYSREGDFQDHFRFMKEQDCKLSFIGHAHSRGIYTVSSEHFKLIASSRLQLNAHPTIIGIPPVTRHGMRSGFIIFDTSSSHIQILKQF